MEQHRVGPHLWNGLSTVRVNCGTAIVGTPQEVAEELLTYWQLGIDEFILSGFPHVEECHRVSHDVLPRLRALIAASQETPIVQRTLTMLTLPRPVGGVLVPGYDATRETPCPASCPPPLLPRVYPAVGIRAAAF